MERMNKPQRKLFIVWLRTIWTRKWVEEEQRDENEEYCDPSQLHPSLTRIPTQQTPTPSQPSQQSQETEAFLSILLSSFLSTIIVGNVTLLTLTLSRNKSDCLIVNIAPKTPNFPIYWDFTTWTRPRRLLSLCTTPTSAPAPRLPRTCPFSLLIRFFQEFICKRERERWASKVVGKRPKGAPRNRIEFPRFPPLNTIGNFECVFVIVTCTGD